MVVNVMRVEIINNITNIFADEGMIFNRDEIFASHVYLGCNDSPTNWREITEEEAKVLQKEIIALKLTV